MDRMKCKQDKIHSIKLDETRHIFTQMFVLLLIHKRGQLSTVLRLTRRVITYMYSLATLKLLTKFMKFIFILDVNAPRNIL